MVLTRDAGLAHDHWKRFYTTEEVDEILTATVTTVVVSCGYPIHVRLYPQPRPAPTVVMAHPMLPYGLLLARLQLPFFRAGFNVVQWDLPGWGQSGGPRAACPVTDFIQAWGDLIDFAHDRIGAPIYVMGLAEDSVTCYYGAANHPKVQAMSLHTLHEYGDPRGLHWLGTPWLVRLKTLGLRLIVPLRTGLDFKAEKALSWDAIFSGPEDGPLLKLFADDPLRVRVFDYRLGVSMVRRLRPRVPFEACRTPVQLLVSEQSRLWPAEMNLHYYNRIGGPKELITLPGVDQLVHTREFMEMYAAHVIRWFRAHGARPAATRRPVEQVARPQGRISSTYVDQVASVERSRA